MSSDILLQPKMDLAEQQKKLKKKACRKRERQWDEYLESVVLSKGEGEGEELENEEQEEIDEEYVPEEDDNDNDNTTADLMKLLGKGAMLLLNQSKVGNDIWKKGLTDDEIKRYSWIFDNMNELEIDIPKILRSNLSDMEKEYIAKALEEVRGNKSLAAKKLGISRRTLYRKIAEYKIPE